jgi:predicted CxxxxCH...CXXCH cytochrome family protein
MLLLLAAVAGCSTSNDGAPVGHLDARGNSAAGWLVAFPGPSLHSRSAAFDYIGNGFNNGTSGCSECHGDALNGGISKVSCVNAACHHNPVVTNWANPAVHGAAAKKAPGSSSFFSCEICHGAGFPADGGPSGFGCVNCHPDHPHPVGWLPGENPGGFTHTDTDPSNAPVCGRCHLNGTNSTLPPPSPPASPGTPPGCFNSTLCHGSDVAPHAVPFADNTHFQASQTTFSNNCSSCHAVAGTSPVAAAPLCTVCHAAGSPLDVTGCASCHAVPPAGSAYPDIAGAHAVHLALNNGAGTPVSCGTCHNGLGSNTSNHYDRANGRPGAGGRVPPGDAAFPATYNAETGASSFDNTALSCSNVSCHGGLARSGGNPGSPLNWRTGTLDVNTQCTNCHASGTAQFNSYNSGRHTSVGDHVSNGCTSCHDTARLAPGHFTNLATAAFEQAPSATLRTGLLYNGTTCNPGAGGITGCHGQETW